MQDAVQLALVQFGLEVSVADVTEVRWERIGT